MRPYCYGCGTTILWMDADPNGDQNATCAQCRAMDEHDFDIEPNVVFDRFGRREESLCQPSSQPTLIASSEQESQPKPSLPVQPQSSKNTNENRTTHMKTREELLMQLVHINAERDTLTAELITNQALEVLSLRQLVSMCYVGLGSEHDLPEEWLDALNNAANGQHFETADLLPYTASVPKRDNAVFLDWLADRLINVYGEDPNIDFVLTLRRIALENT